MATRFAQVYASISGREGYIAAAAALVVTAAAVLLFGDAQSIGMTHN